MKKMITWIMVLVMALSLTSFAAAEEAVTLRLWMWDDAQQPAMRAMADEYEASHPNVTIEISCQADHRHVRRPRDLLHELQPGV